MVFCPNMPKAKLYCNKLSTKITHTSSGHYYKQILTFYVYLINNVYDLYIDYIYYLLNESKK